MAGDCGPNALSLLPENVLPQWQQKIALCAENIVGRCPFSDPIYFLHEVQFSAGIGPAHIPAETTRPLGPRLSAIFTFFMNNSQIRNKSNRDPDGFSGFAFFLPLKEDFFSLNGVARPCRAL